MILGSQDKKIKARKDGPRRLADVKSFKLGDPLEPKPTTVRSPYQGKRREFSE